MATWRMCFLGGRCRISEGLAPSPSMAGLATYSLAFTSCTQCRQPSPSSNAPLGATCREAALSQGSMPQRQSGLPRGLLSFWGGRWRISEGVAPSPSMGGLATYSLAFTSCTQYPQM